MPRRYPTGPHPQRGRPGEYPQHPDPSPEEIDRICCEIRSEWGPVRWAQQGVHSPVQTLIAHDPRPQSGTMSRDVADSLDE